MRKIILLGASGSIGTQTIDVVKHHPDQFEIVGLSIGKNINVLRKILTEIKVSYVCVQNYEDMEILQKEFPKIHFYYGSEGLKQLSVIEEANLVVNALVGFVGLIPTLLAIESKKDIALANKETLVVGGYFVKKAIQKNKVNLYPIDSEHSAIFQCLRGNEHKEIEKIIITASGGSLRDKTREELKYVTKNEALHHPNWSMGSKITIDSATMMNKGLEVIEAHWLFDLPYEKIDVLMHQESVIHSMVQYQDHAIIAQLGSADMRLPIQYALSYPKRLPLLNSEPLDFSKYSCLHFSKVDFHRYPFLKLAYEVGKKGGNATAIMNGANEAAVALFLDDKISFLDIERLVFDAINECEFIEHPTLDDVIESDRLARQFVNEHWKGE